MAIKKIKFNDKRAFSNDFTPAEADMIITAENMNEIKSVINTNADDANTLRNSINTTNDKITRIAASGVNNVSYNRTPEYRKLSNGNIYKSGEIRKFTISYPSVPNINSNQQISHYYLALRIGDVGSQSNDDNSNVVFVINPPFSDQSNGLSNVAETQSLCSFMRAWGKNFLAQWQINKEWNYVHVTMRLIALYDSKLDIANIKINWEWGVKINNIAVNKGL